MTAIVINSLGKKIDLIKIGKVNSVRFELNQQPAGIYFIKLIRDNGDYTVFKVIKQ